MPYDKGCGILRRLGILFGMPFQGRIVEVGFEPTKHNAADLKSAPFNHSGTQLQQGTTVPRPLPSIIRAEDF